MNRKVMNNLLSSVFALALATGCAKKGSPAVNTPSAVKVETVKDKMATSLQTKLTKEGFSATQAQVIASAFSKGSFSLFNFFVDGNNDVTTIVGSSGGAALVALGQSDEFKATRGKSAIVLMGVLTEVALENASGTDIRKAVTEKIAVLPVEKFKELNLPAGDASTTLQGINGRVTERLLGKASDKEEKSRLMNVATSKRQKAMADAAKSNDAPFNGLTWDTLASLSFQIELQVLSADEDMKSNSEFMVDLTAIAEANGPEGVDFADAAEDFLDDWGMSEAEFNAEMVESLKEIFTAEGVSAEDLEKMVLEVFDDLSSGTDSDTSTATGTATASSTTTTVVNNTDDDGDDGFFDDDDDVQDFVPPNGPEGSTLMGLWGSHMDSQVDGKYYIVFNHFGMDFSDVKVRLVGSKDNTSADCQSAAAYDSGLLALNGVVEVDSQSGDEYQGYVSLSGLTAAGCIDAVIKSIQFTSAASATDIVKFEVQTGQTVYSKYISADGGTSFTQQQLDPNEEQDMGDVIYPDDEGGGGGGGGNGSGAYFDPSGSMNIMSSTASTLTLGGTVTFATGTRLALSSDQNTTDQNNASIIVTAKVDVYVLDGSNMCPNTPTTSNYSPVFGTATHNTTTNAFSVSANIPGGNVCKYVLKEFTVMSVQSDDTSYWWHTAWTWDSAAPDTLGAYYKRRTGVSLTSDPSGIYEASNTGSYDQSFRGSQVSVEP